MKKLVVPRCLEGVEGELFFADAFLFGVKDLSVQFENTYPIEKLKEVSSFLHQHGKKIFVSCNKNIAHTDRTSMVTMIIPGKSLRILLHSNFK